MGDSPGGGASPAASSGRGLRVLGVGERELAGAARDLRRAGDADEGDAVLALGPDEPAVASAVEPVGPRAAARRSCLPPPRMRSSPAPPKRLSRPPAPKRGFASASPSRRSPSGPPRQATARSARRSSPRPKCRSGSSRPRRRTPPSSMGQGRRPDESEAHRLVEGRVELEPKPLAALSEISVEAAGADAVLRRRVSAGGARNVELAVCVDVDHGALVRGGRPSGPGRRPGRRRSGRRRRCRSRRRRRPGWSGRGGPWRRRSRRGRRGRAAAGVVARVDRPDRGLGVDLGPEADPAGLADLDAPAARGGVAPEVVGAGVRVVERGGAGEDDGIVRREAQLAPGVGARAGAEEEGGGAVERLAFRRQGDGAVGGDAEAARKAVMRLDRREGEAGGAGADELVAPDRGPEPDVGAAVAPELRDGRAGDAPADRDRARARGAPSSILARTGSCRPPSSGSNTLSERLGRSGAVAAAG